jgi:hypothetical protein
MNWRSKRTFVAGVAVLALAGGGSAAYATTRSASGTAAKAADQPFLVGVANRLHIDANDLLAAMKAEATARVDAAVAAGNLPASAAEQIKARIAAATLEHPLGFFGPRARHPARGAVRVVAQAAAVYAGIDVVDLRSEVFAGKPLAQIATEHGKSVAGLKEAIIDAVAKRLADAGRLTAEQRQRILDRLKSRIDEIVNRSFKRR